MRNTTLFFFFPSRRGLAADPSLFPSQDSSSLPRRFSRLFPLGIEQVCRWWLSPLSPGIRGHADDCGQFQDGPFFFLFFRLPDSEPGNPLNSHLPPFSPLHNAPRHTMSSVLTGNIPGPPFLARTVAEGLVGRNRGSFTCGRNPYCPLPDGCGRGPRRRSPFRSPTPRCLSPLLHPQHGTGPFVLDANGGLWFFFEDRQVLPPPPSAGRKTTRSPCPPFLLLCCERDEECGFMEREWV